MASPYPASSVRHIGAVSMESPTTSVPLLGRIGVRVVRAVRAVVGRDGRPTRSTAQLHLDIRGMIADEVGREPDRYEVWAVLSFSKRLVKLTGRRSGRQ